MRFGVCTGVENAVILASAGYDYIEITVTGNLMPEADETAWTEKRHAIEAMPLRPEAFNIFLGNLKVVGPEVEPARVEKYVHSALTRAAQVGGEIIVFGSGGARRVPDGFSRTEAETQIETFLGYCADASDKTGMVVVVEPLNKKESNMINSVGEGANWVRRINRPGIRNLADTYHMEMDNESLGAIVLDADVLAHTHTADTGRFAPGTGTYDHIAFFHTLREVGYDKRLSIECGWENLAEQAASSLEHLKKSYSAVNGD